MRRLRHLLMSPPCRLVRLALAEKRVPCELDTAEDPAAHLPVLKEEDGTELAGLWAIIDHLEADYPEPPLVPEDAAARREALRLLDWVMTRFHLEVTQRIVYEKGSRAHTGSTHRRPPDMETIRSGRTTLMRDLAMLGALAEARGFLAGRDLSLADLGVAAHLSALDYYGEIPWADVPPAVEWYRRMKSRPAFRTLLNDRVPGQPPVLHYAELDF